MAEAFLQKHAGDRFTVWSAGSEPAAEVHPMAIDVLAEEGIDLDGHYPKDYREFLEGDEPAYVIFVCGHAARACPVWPGPAERVFWPFEDPAAATGTRAERLERFRDVRDRIEARVLSWLREPGRGSAERQEAEPAGERLGR